MSNLNETSFILKLIELTKEKKIEWDYLDEYRDVYQELSMQPRSPLYGKSSLEVLAEFGAGMSKIEFDSDNSFATCINENYIIIYASIVEKKEPKLLGERLSLMLVPRTFKDIKRLRDNEEEHLVRLHTLIKSGFPNSEDIINDILGM